MERQELIDSVRGRTKLYGGLRPDAGDEEKLEAAQILMQTVKQGIALMQLTNAEHPAFNATPMVSTVPVRCQWKNIENFIKETYQFPQAQPQQEQDLRDYVQ